MSNSNITVTGSGPGVANVGKYTTVCYVGVQNAPIGFSLDGGSTYMTLAANKMHRMYVSTVRVVHISGAGAWQILATYEDFYNFDEDII